MIPNDDRYVKRLLGSRINNRMSHKNRKIIPYCYLIGWPELNRYYFGVKFGIGANPDKFWKSYFTSSVLVKKYRKMHGEPKIIEIRKVFYPEKYGSINAAQEQSVKYENSVLRRMKMVIDDRFLNCSNNVKNRTGTRIVNYTKFRREQYNGHYHSAEGLKSMQQFNKTYSKEHNNMSRPEVKARHLDSIAEKIGYESHAIYVDTIKKAFEKYKTIKGTSDNTGHAQYTIRQLLIENYGRVWIEAVRKQGLIDAKERSINTNRNRDKQDSVGDKNYNAYVWEAISPDGNITIIKGNRIQFCKDRKISTSLDPNKPHLRCGWEFRKICKVKDY